MQTIDSFIKNAQGLTKNPLGIIALFVSLIYGFACLVLSNSITNLYDQAERLPLIWFIITFPLVILIAFIFLVVYHHEKLYSPSDYRGDEAFFQALGKKRVREKQLNEVNELETAKTEEVNADADANDAQLNDKSEAAQEKSASTENTDGPNHDQKVKYGEQRTGSKIFEAESTEYKKQRLVEIYKNSEEWVAQELSLKYNIIFKTNMVFAFQGGRIEVDAIGMDNKRAYLAEIKYWQANKSDKRLKLSIQNFLLKYNRLESAFKKDRDFKLIVALVFDDLDKINKIDYLNFVKTIYEGASVEFFEYNDLKQNYE